MPLSNDLITQFVKATTTKKKEQKESTLYGTVFVQNASKYVKLDGSDRLTPITTTADIKHGERVSVLIKNHTAMVTGNLSSPAARIEDVLGSEAAYQELSNKIVSVQTILADKVDTKDLNAANGRIDNLVSDNILIRQELVANDADISSLTTDNVDIKKRLTASEANITNLETSKLDAIAADIKYATITNLDATNATLHNLESTYGKFEVATTEKLTAHTADITNLKTSKLSVEDAKITYANIDFSNIGKAAMEYFYANSGLIENVIVNNGTITGNLIGVTIKGDLIEGSTIIADKLVVQGEDGLYYKLNTSGSIIEAEQTEYNSLNGKVILAKSITATQINVSDLVAFDATIGGFNITEHSIYSEVKDAAGNPIRGVYMDDDGQINFGDGDQFIKYYKDENGSYKLAIAADTILYSVNNVQYSVADLGAIGEYVKISTYNNEPCIELGEQDSDFKLRITNTKMLFMEGTNVIAQVTNQSLHIEKAVIEDELQQGGFIWKTRSNGNLGLMWKGGV